MARSIASGALRTLRSPPPSSPHPRPCPCPQATIAKQASFNQSLYSESDGSHVTTDYAAALAIECILAVIASIVALSERAAQRACESEVEDDAPPVVIGGVTLSVAEAARGEAQLVRALVAACCTPLLSSLALATARFSTNEATQAMLKAFQVWRRSQPEPALFRRIPAPPRPAFAALTCRATPCARSRSRTRAAG